MRASALLQLCTYAELLARIQGVAPKHVTVALGGGERRVERHRIADYVAFYRSLKRRFEAAAAIGDTRPPVYPPDTTYPDPVDHCAVCRWWAVCSDRRRADDDLSLVAGMTRGQRRRLPEHGAGTRRALARFPLPPPKIEGTSREAVSRVREQARVQVQGEDEDRLLVGAHRARPWRGRGDRAQIAASPSLPPPAPGDLFLDFEGDPFAFDDGLEYLVGIAEPGAALIAAQPTLGLAAAGPGHPAHLPPVLGAEPGGGKAGVRVADRLHRRAPSTGPAAARLPLRLVRTRAGRSPLHATRDARGGSRRAAPGRGVRRPLPRGPAGDPGVGRELLDQAPRGALRVHPRDRVARGRQEHRGVRAVPRGWAGPTHRSSTQIEAYNRDDCISTWRLRDWLEARRGEAVARWGDLPRAGVEEPEPQSRRPRPGATVAEV